MKGKVKKSLFTDKKKKKLAVIQDMSAFMMNGFSCKNKLKYTRRDPCNSEATGILTRYQLLFQKMLSLVV